MACPLAQTLMSGAKGNTLRNRAQERVKLKETLLPLAPISYTLVFFPRERSADKNFTSRRRPSSMLYRRIASLRRPTCMSWRHGKAHVAPMETLRQSNTDGRLAPKESLSLLVPVSESLKTLPTWRFSCFS